MFSQIFRMGQLYKWAGPGPLGPLTMHQPTPQLNPLKYASIISRKKIHDSIPDIRLMVCCVKHLVFPG